MREVKQRQAAPQETQADQEFKAARCRPWNSCAILPPFPHAPGLRFDPPPSTLGLSASNEEVTSPTCGRLPPIWGDLHEARLAQHYRESALFLSRDLMNNTDC
jgi:hypothetical protein